MVCRLLYWATRDASPAVRSKRIASRETCAVRERPYRKKHWQNCSSSTLLWWKYRYQGEPKSIDRELIDPTVIRRASSLVSELCECSWNRFPCLDHPRRANLLEHRATVYWRFRLLFFLSAPVLVFVGLVIIFEPLLDVFGGIVFRSCQNQKWKSK